MRIFTDPTVMETFTNPPPRTYLLWSRFIMPTEEGGVLGIAASDRDAFYVASAYTILIAGIFGFSWQITTYAALLFYPTEAEGSPEINKDKISDSYEKFDSLPEDQKSDTMKELLEVRKRKANRYVALVAIWNSSDPWSAMYLLIKHAYLCFGDNETWTGIYDTIVIAVALLLALGGIAASIIVSGQIEMGTVAPANPANIFFTVPNDTAGVAVRVQQTRAPAAQRAMGAVEAAGGQLMKRVNISPPQRMDWTGPDGEVVEQTTYSFNLTGVDFGLQHMDAFHFVMSTKGACTLEYGWFSLNESLGEYDVYDQFGSPFVKHYISRSPRDRSVSADVILPVLTPEERLEIMENGGNVTYAIIPDTVSRYSYTNGTDPWYLTIATNLNDTYPQFRVANRRPALSCWQQDTWSYKGTVKPLNDLKSLPGLDLPAVIRDVLIPSRLAYPMIYDIASSLGGSILTSSASSTKGFLDAGISKYSTDLERLIRASFVASQEILRDSTMIHETYDLNNDALEAPNTPKPGVGDFVINSGKVSTISFKLLISIPCVFLFLFTVLQCLRFTRFTHRNSGLASRFTMRTVGLQAVQMYRLLDEELCGYRNDWTGRKGHMPHIHYAKEICHHPPVSPQAVGVPGSTGDKKPKLQVSGENTDHISRDDIIGTGADTIALKRALFIAPKVKEDTVYGGYHLRFTGPTRSERRQKNKPYKWSWRGETPSDHVVINEPKKKP